MPKALHIAALSFGLAWLIVASLARHSGPEPKVEFLSYLALGAGLFELISIVRNGLNRATPSRFSGATTLLLFCTWTGGSPFVGVGGLRNTGILVIAWIISYAASRWAIRRPNPDLVL